MSKLNLISSISKLDFSQIGLKCGLEIHQQLNTGKLFSRMPCKIVPNMELDKQVKRTLRFSKGESGDIDKAAHEESLRSLKFTYMYNDEIASLVELDEQPPLDLNERALNTVIGVGEMLNINFFPKFQFMRKLIVDGSIPSGFQRTALLGVNGYIETSFGKVSIEGLHLEEDSCRIISKNQGQSIYSLDRLGIPLIELSTGPDIKQPKQAYEVAKQLGNILRSFPYTKRGLGTIRQDLNVSIENGARVEIKGTQNLDLIPEIIEYEAKRQFVYLQLISEILNRGIKPGFTKNLNPIDVTSIFKNTKSKVLQSNLDGKDKVIYAIHLPKFEGILGTELQRDFSRFASEISDRLKKNFSDLNGLFHHDELPSYGITSEEVERVKNKIHFTSQSSFIMIALDLKRIDLVFEKLKQLIEELSFKVPSEVRQVDPKGTNTKYMRAMPGAARMYPETDLELYELEPDKILSLKKSLPELYDKKLSRLSRKWDLEQNKIEEVLTLFSEEEVSNLISRSEKSAKSLYSILFDIPKDIKKRENLEPINFKVSLLQDLLQTSQDKNLSNQTIRDIFISLYKDNLAEVENLENYLKSKGFTFEQVSMEEIRDELKNIISQNPGAPFGALMGLAMKHFKGKVDGKILSKELSNLANK